MKVDLEKLKLHVNKYEQPEGWVSSISVNCRLGQSEMGTASADRLTRRQWAVTRVFIPANYRGEGVGGLLLERVKTELLTVEGFRHIIVEPGGYGSEPTRLHNFYTRHGFEQKGENIYVWGRRRQEARTTQASTGA